MGEHQHKLQTGKRVKSYQKFYLSLLIVFLIIIIVCEAYQPNKERVIQDLGIVYFTFIGLMMLINGIESNRVSDYVKKYHSEKWNQLTTNMGVYKSDGFRLLGFIFSKDDLHDPNLKYLKSSFRRWLVFLLVMVLVLPFFNSIIISILRSN